MQDDTKSRILTLITGSGTSVAFGFPSTSEFTGLISTSLRQSFREDAQVLRLYDDICTSLGDYLINPGEVTFEDIYQSIQDVASMQQIPSDRGAYDDFRPRIAATHVLNDRLKTYSRDDGSILQDSYLDTLLTVFLDSLTSLERPQILRAALDYLAGHFLIWSFTLNYDNLISDVFDLFVSGFNHGVHPRSFIPTRLLSAVDDSAPIHCHLHGSLKLGFPGFGTIFPFDLHEYDTPQEGVRHSIHHRPSGRPLQNGVTLSPSPIITGLNKTELVFRQPFFTNFLTFFKAMELCTDIIIAGYGFRDRHVNIGIGHLRRTRPNVRVFIVALHPNDDPISYVNDMLSVDAWHDAILAHADSARPLPGFPNWWTLEGITHGPLNTAPIFLWLKGFDAFCEDVLVSGLPQ